MTLSDHERQKATGVQFFRRISVPFDLEEPNLAGNTFQKEAYFYGSATPNIARGGAPTSQKIFVTPTLSLLDRALDRANKFGMVICGEGRISSGQPCQGVGAQRPQIFGIPYTSQNVCPYGLTYSDQIRHDNACGEGRVSSRWSARPHHGLRRPVPKILGSQHARTRYENR